MTREEQIKQAGIEYTYRNRPMCIGGGAFSEMVDEMNRNKAFEEGAKWADEHPNQTEEEEVGMGGLGMEWQKQALIKKACEWITQYIDIPYEVRMTEEGPIASDYINYAKKRLKYVEEVVNDFKKAME